MTVMNRRSFSRNAASVAGALVLAGAGVPLRARAQGFVPLEGRDFQSLAKPIAVPANGKIEVIEFFSYACPHCSAYEPVLGPWLKQLPADVAVRRVPVTFLMNADNFQRTYYSLEAMGIVDQLQLKIFRAIHIDRLRL